MARPTLGKRRFLAAHNSLLRQRKVGRPATGSKLPTGCLPVPRCAGIRHVANVRRSPFTMNFVSRRVRQLPFRKPGDLASGVILVCHDTPRPTAALPSTAEGSARVRTANPVVDHGTPALSPLGPSGTWGCVGRSASQGLPGVRLDQPPAAQRRGSVNVERGGDTRRRPTIAARRNRVSYCPWVSRNLSGAASQAPVNPRVSERSEPGFLQRSGAPRVGAVGSHPSGAWGSKVDWLPRAAMGLPRPLGPPRASQTASSPINFVITSCALFSR
jgi:hypothetical protein